MKIVVDLELSPRQKRIMRHAVVASVVVAVLGVGVALATVPNTFNTGEPLSSSKMNQNFTYLDNKARFVAMADGGQYSVGATLYVGETTTGGPSSNGTYTGSQVGGYKGSKTICETLTSSATAHICTSEEIVRSAAIGLMPPPTTGGTTHAWYAGGVTAYNGANFIYDCSAFTSSQSNILGFAIVFGSWQPDFQTCNVASPVLCCD